MLFLQRYSKSKFMFPNTRPKYLPLLRSRQYLSSIQCFRSNYRDMPSLCSAYQPNAEHLQGRTLSLRRPKSPRKLPSLKGRQWESYLSPEEALWFTSLPDKIQRQCFTREERILIRAGCEIVLSPSFSSDTHSRRVSNTSQLDWLELPQTAAVVNDETEEDTLDNLTPSSVHSDDMYEHQMFSQTSSSIISIDYPNSSTRTSYVPQQHRRSSGIRNFSLPSSRTTDTESLKAASWPSDNLLYQEEPGRSVSPARFYHDPEARAKLRRYIATPQDFDQALAERETTFRMTLTRPGLRSMADSHSWQHHDGRQFENFRDEGLDPLALEPLPFSDDTTGLHGHFVDNEVEGKGVRRIWKLLNRKSSISGHG